ncbi:MAG: hypothetical protein R6V67_06115 [Spirochaetia bacterium]
MWEDLRVTADMVTLGDMQHTGAPKRVRIASNSERGSSYSGLFGCAFDHGKEGRGLFQNAYFHCQLPHSYMEGSAIEPHAHIRLVPGGNAVAGQKLLLEFEYIWVNIGEPAPEDTEIIPLNYEVTPSDISSGNSLVSFGLIEKPDAGISSMLSCRFSRITVEDGWRDFWSPRGVENDSFEGLMILLEFDFHYRTDSTGSREIYRK